MNQETRIMEKKIFKIVGVAITGIIVFAIICIVIYFSKSNVLPLDYYCNGLYKVTGECNSRFCHPIDRCIEETTRITGMVLFCDKEIIGCTVSDFPNSTQSEQPINIESKPKKTNFLDIPI